MQIIINNQTTKDDVDILAYLGRFDQEQLTGNFWARVRWPNGVILISTRWNNNAHTSLTINVTDSND